MELVELGLSRLEDMLAVQPRDASICQSELSSPGYLVWGALRKEAVIGYVVVDSRITPHEIHMIAVHPESRRQGIGFRMLTAVVAKYRSIFLEVSDSNTAAQKLYARAGFREVGRRKAYYNDGSDAILMQVGDEIVMERNISET